MNDQQFLDTLRRYISFVFNNEEKFIDKFFLRGYINCFYMSSGICAVILYDSNNNLTHATIQTDKFLNWVDSK